MYRKIQWHNRMGTKGRGTNGSTVPRLMDASARHSPTLITRTKAYRSPDDNEASIAFDMREVQHARCYREYGAD